MATQLIAVLCEGPHDVAFLNKILKSRGFVANESTALGEYPAPMANLLTEAAKNANVEELNIQSVRRILIPTHVLKRNNDYLFLYSMGGDGQKDNRLNLLQQFKDRIPAEGEYSELPKDTTLGIAYFWDADQKGIESRLEELATELEIEVFSNENGSIILNEGLKIGGYVFAAAEETTGDLEDILLPLMWEGNEQLFESAQNFLQVNYDEKKLGKLKLRINETQDIVEKRESKKKKAFKYNEKKSLIGVVGQTQNSGKGNSPIINDCDFITL